MKYLWLAVSVLSLTIGLSGNVLAHATDRQVPHFSPSLQNMQVAQQEEAGFGFPGVRFLTEVGVIPEEGKEKIPGFDERFAKGQKSFGLQLGYGFTFNLPPVLSVNGDRTNFQFLYFAPNFKYNLTGIIGNSYFRGALYWVVDLQLVVGVTDPDRGNITVDQGPNYMFGITPLQVEYKFLDPARKWAPFVFGGAGVAIGDFHRGAREIQTAFEFILQVGGGIEWFLDNGSSVNFNYRLWHISNSNIKGPNIGLNAHVFSLGYTF